MLSPMYIRHLQLACEQHSAFGSAYEVHQVAECLCRRAPGVHELRHLISLMQTLLERGCQLPEALQTAWDQVTHLRIFPPWSYCASSLCYITAILQCIRCMHQLRCTRSMAWMKQGGGGLGRVGEGVVARLLRKDCSTLKACVRCLSRFHM